MDVDSQFIFGLHSNYDPAADAFEVNRRAALDGEAKEPFRCHPQYWLVGDELYAGRVLRPKRVRRGASPLWGWRRRTGAQGFGHPTRHTSVGSSPRRACDCGASIAALLRTTSPSPPPASILCPSVACPTGTALQSPTARRLCRQLGLAHPADRAPNAPCADSATDADNSPAKG